MRVAIALILASVASAAYGFEQNPNRPQGFGTAFICSNSVERQDCDQSTAREAIKVTCGGTGASYGIAQLAELDAAGVKAGSVVTGEKPRHAVFDASVEYVKLRCTIGVRPQNRAETR